MSEVRRNANAYTIQEENSTTYCTPRSHPGETPALLEFYGAMRYRARRWRSFQKEQRSIHRLISEIESMRTKDTMVLAYGSAVHAISNLKTRGVAPCINMGAAPTLVEALLGGRYAGTLYFEDVLGMPRMLRSVRGVGDASSRGTESQSHHRP